MTAGYLVWYRLEGDDHDRIGGIALSYTAGVEMSERLYSIKKVIDKLPIISCGVKLCQTGTVYSHENFEQRWQIIPLKTGPQKNPRY